MGDCRKHIARISANNRGKHIARILEKITQISASRKKSRKNLTNDHEEKSQISVNSRNKLRITSNDREKNRKFRQRIAQKISNFNKRSRKKK